MSRFTPLAGTFLRPVLGVSRLDLRLARLRLHDLGVRHFELSARLSLDDSPGAPNERLIDLLVALTSRTRRLSLAALSQRQPPDLIHLWPGEHYRLLAALVQELNPRNIVEIGTFTGLSALAMLEYLPSNSRLTTFDVIEWDRIPGTFLRPSDFSSRKLTQIICDLKEPENCRIHTSLLQSADLIFIDGPKDGIFEQRLLDNFASIPLQPHTLLVFDDIHIWNMLGIWRKIPQPKLDMTTIGHFTGTGLVDWVPSHV
jgi:predicted O-methyltransferase YrrM